MRPPLNRYISLVKFRLLVVLVSVISVFLFVACSDDGRLVDTQQDADQTPSDDTGGGDTGPTPFPDITLFSTESSQEPNVGISGFDTACTTAQSAQSISGSTVKSIISTPTAAIKDIIPLADQSKRIMAPDGTTQIKSAWSDLFSGGPVSIDIDLQTAGIALGFTWWWSGSNNDGTASTNTCSNWTDTSIGFGGQVGLTTSATGSFMDNGVPNCATGSTKTLLCIAYDPN